MRANQSKARLALREAKFMGWYLLRNLSLLLHPGVRRFPVAILYLTADRGKYPGTRAFVNRYRRQLGHRNACLLCIDNFDEKAPAEEVAPGMWRMGGDNSAWEFSGWKKGVQQLAMLPLPPEVVICINDACLNRADDARDELFFRMRFDWQALALARTSLIGCRDQHDTGNRLFGLDVDNWIRSNFFALPYSLARSLPWDAVSATSSHTIIPAVFTRDVIPPSEHITEGLRNYLIDWISRKWPQARQPNARNWALLRMKLIAILNERLLSAHARQRGVSVIDLTRRIFWL